MCVEEDVAIDTLDSKRRVITDNAISISDNVLAFVLLSNVFANCCIDTAVDANYINKGFANKVMKESLELVKKEDN